MFNFDKIYTIYLANCSKIQHKVWSGLHKGERLFIAKGNLVLFGIFLRDYLEYLLTNVFFCNFLFYYKLSHRIACFDHPFFWVL